MSAVYIKLKRHISSLELETIFDQPEEKTIKQNYSFSFDDVFECAALEYEVYYKLREIEEH